MNNICASDAQKKSESGVAHVLTAQNFDAMQAVGGWRGIGESVLPTVLFLILYIATRQTMLAVAVAVAVCALALIVRAAQKITISPALGGLGAMLISAVLAWRTGDAANVFLWGILTNIAYGLGLAISALVRWPLLGVLIGWIRGEGTEWRTAEKYRRTRHIYYAITWLWVGLFAIRLAIQLPLYYAHATEALGIAKLVLGLPLFALIAWLSWMLVQSLHGESLHQESLDQGSQSFDQESISAEALDKEPLVKKAPDVETFDAQAPDTAQA